ncbi:hypothetical protein GCK72_019634 [Caenorhabditis remanei]|uniref:F-box domain-containing protein n=1 Tax=Caenorhabditis remanei TaxID=31234 RepID=A0A6A5GD57_CAERE|nr:hypothetical protein GCK72_019634 [Caenorhabditis remanei]KAF1753078.1 hypothetical protein GCK72_019634 [Caenorhabditis remanei]
MVSLTEMPELVMNNILEKLDLRSILSLRKVCHDLRNFIDDGKPDPHLTEIEITVKYSSITLIMRIHHLKLINHEIKYKKEDTKGCSVVYEKREKLLENENYISTFAKDLEVVLTVFESKMKLEKFDLNWRYAHHEVFDEVSKKMESILKPYKLKVKKVTIEAFEQSHVMSILPYLDPKPLYQIDISEACLPDYSVYKNNPLKLDEVVELEQWKDANEILIARQVELPDMKNLENARCVFVTLDSIKLEDLIELKEQFLLSRTLGEYDMEYASFDEQDQFFEPFGVPYLEYQENPDSKQWFFKTEHPDQILQIHHYNDGVWHVKFVIFNKRRIPSEAIIQ